MKPDAQRDIVTGYRRALPTRTRRPTSVADLEAAGIKVREQPKAVKRNG